MNIKTNSDKINAKENTYIRPAQKNKIKIQQHEILCLHVPQIHEKCILIEKKTGLAVFLIIAFFLNLFYFILTYFFVTPFKKHSYLANEIIKSKINISFI